MKVPWSPRLVMLYSPSVCPRGGAPIGPGRVSRIGDQAGPCMHASGASERRIHGEGPDLRCHALNPIRNLQSKGDQSLD
jgi:hypothetical protein